MPSKDSAAKRKSRVEVREEFHLALQRQQQASQHVDGPSGSQHESPVLPLVLPTSSTHSTTDSTGTTDPAPPIRSCTFVTTHLPTESGTVGASSNNKRRGVVIGKKTAAITKEKGRTSLTYDDSVRGLPIAVRSRFVTDLSAYIKDRCPMLHPSWSIIPETERTRLLEFLYAWVQQASDEASMPPIENTSDGSSPALVTAPPRLPVDVEIEVMERVVGHSRGTRVPSLGSGVAKQPRMREPSQPAEPRNEAVAEELVRLREHQKELEERLQQQEQERQEHERKRLERERVLERERLERERELERERLKWETRIQVQLAEMARQMRVPPFDGFNTAP